MKLNKRYVRNIRENASFYISSTVLTMVTLLLFFLFSIAGNAILNFGEEFFLRNNLEDAHFSTYLPIPEEKIAALEKDYGVTLEAQKYINITTDGITARVFQRTKKIDLYEITVGKDAIAEDEIIISEGYAIENNIVVGDSMKIADRTYTVSGFFQRPDYLYMLENEDDSYKNITTFYLCYIAEDAFASLGDTGVQYLVRYEEGSDITGFRKAVHADYFMRTYISAEDNNRILMVNQQAELFIVMAYLLLCVMPLIAVVLISIIISRKVKSEQRMLGTLSALGYTKRRLMWHYAGFAAIPGILGGVLTAVFSLIFAQPMSEMGLADYEPMRVVGRLSPLDAALGILLPTALYVFAALLSVRRLLKKDTVLLLAGNADGGKKRSRRLLAEKKLPFQKKFAVRSLLGNPGRSFVVLLGVFLGCFIVLTAQAFFDSIDYMGTAGVDALVGYEHQYLLSGLATENPYGGETMLVSALEAEDGTALSLIGTENENPYLSFQTTEGKDADLEDGYYITSLTQLTLGWQSGDSVTVYHPLTMEKKKIKIAGVIQNNMQKGIYTSKSAAAKISGLDADSFNCIVSGEKLNIPEAEVAQETERSDIVEQVNTMTEQMDFMLLLLEVLGVIICVASIYVAVNMLVTESRSNISMLKVLGYDDRRINRIVLSAHHILLPMGILLSIPATYAFTRAFFLMMVDYGVMLIDTYIAPKSFCTAIGLTVLCYFGSLWLLRRKVKKVDMVESLKDNRE